MQAETKNIKTIAFDKQMFVNHQPYIHNDLSEFKR